MAAPSVKVPPIFGAVVRPIQQFLRLEAASGIVLLFNAIAALVWANVHPESYLGVFDFPLTFGAGRASATFTLRELINDGLMTIFFFVVGMEIKREMVLGELDTLAKASLPAIAALGGMVLPSAIFLAFNWGGPGMAGWGIPMATDIAFCVGVLTVLRNRVPQALIAFLTALAIFDDIGGILVIAFFYGHGIDGLWLLAAGGVCAGLFVLNQTQASRALLYAAGIAGLWYSLHHGGIHATIAGVIAGMMIPARPRRPTHEVLRELDDHVTPLAKNPPDEEIGGIHILMIEQKLEELQSPLSRFIHALHATVAFGIMPLFALANSGVILESVGVSTLLSPVALGTGLGLFLGKQIGVLGFTLAAARIGLAPMPGRASIFKLYGVSVVAGIGFTVALFIAGLAFRESPELLDQAKLGILLGSLVAGLAGAAILRLTPAIRR